MINKISFRY